VERFLREAMGEALSFANNSAVIRVAMLQCVHIGGEGSRVVELRQSFPP
jgi:hypothetical protein